MALLPTGTTPSADVEKSHHQEECCPHEDLTFEYDCPVELMCDSAILPAVSQTGCNTEGTTVSLEEGLNLLDRVHSDVSLGGNVYSSVPSPPLSDCSSDSGVLGSVQSTEETFLAGLFGSDFALLQGSQLDLSSPTPSPSNQSAFSFAQMSAPETHEPHSKSEKVASRLTKVEDFTVVDKNRKNAEAARQNRIKKKKYVEGLEKERSTLKTENVILKTKCHEYQGRCQRLQSEVEYLKSVLANESVLSSLIQNIPSIPGVKLTSSFRKRARSCDSGDGSTSERDGTATKKIRLVSSAGVCLHVAKNLVSLEFCEKCSKQASML